jgi:hypothetical protein
MTVAEVAKLMRPEYDHAPTDDEKRAVLRRWDAALADAEPEPEQPPVDDLQTAIDKAMASWKRHGRNT